MPARSPRRRLSLIFRQGVHRIDDHGADAGRRAFIPQVKAPADDRVKETLGLAGAGARRDQRRTALGDGTDRTLLVAVEVRNVFGNALPQMRVEQPFGDQGIHGRAFAERPRQLR